VEDDHLIDKLTNERKRVVGVLKSGGAKGGVYAMYHIAACGRCQQLFAFMARLRFRATFLHSWRRGEGETLERNQMAD